MSDSNWLPLDHVTAVVTGAASGIGAAVAEMLVGAGAAVHAIDLAPVRGDVSQTIECDLGSRESIDAAVAALPATVDWVMNCAGVPNGGRFSAAEVMAVNWLGLRHLSEQLIDRIPENGSITHVASTAGRAWHDNLAHHQGLMQAETFDEGAAWVASHASVIGDGYSFSKQAVQYYTLWQSLSLRAEREIRMNSVCPGVTNTQIAADFRKGVGDDVIDRAISLAGRAAEPAEMAPAMLFLADHRTASYINGINLNVDRGTGAAHLLNAW